MKDDNDKVLIEKYLEGDEKSLEILIQNYLGPIYRFAYKYAGNEKDAEDITQDVFVKMWRNLKKFDQNKSFKTWIFSIAKNTAIDFLKKSRSAFGGKKSLPFSQFDTKDNKNIIEETFANTMPLPQEIFEKQEIIQELNSVISRLLPKYQTVLSLRYNDDLTFKEISEELEKPLNTVKSRHRRALIILKKLLKNS